MQKTCCFGLHLFKKNIQPISFKVTKKLKFLPLLYIIHAQLCILDAGGFDFFRLYSQRPLQVELQIMMATCKQTIQYVVELEPGLPLLSNMWNQCGIPQLQFLESGMREACEHSESDDKHSSLESSI